MRRIVLMVVAAIVVLVGFAPTSGAAVVSAVPLACVSCGTGGTSGGGYTATAQVQFSGDAAPGGGGVVSRGVPATCWWEQAQLSRLDGSSYIDPSNADQLESWFKDLPKMINGSFAIYRVAYSDMSLWQPILDKIRAGEKFTAYEPRCRQEAPDCALVDFSGIAMPPSAASGVCGIPVAIGFFRTGAPPTAQVAPADLARVARDEMVIPEPVVDRNPKVTALAGATLVGLPTWFWVTDPTSIGGTTGTRTIRAQVGPIWAEVVAKTDGLQLTSPAGDTRCGPDTAMTQYRRGVADSDACTVWFSAASVGYPGGYPVDASTAWTAAWTGSDNTRGDLPPLQRGTRVNVPVAESQTVVTDAR